MLPLLPSKPCLRLPIEKPVMSAGAWLPQNKAQAWLAHSKAAILQSLRTQSRGVRGTTPPIYAKATPRQAGGHGPPAGGCPYIGETDSTADLSAKIANPKAQEEEQVPRVEWRCVHPSVYMR